MTPLTTPTAITIGATSTGSSFILPLLLLLASGQLRPTLADTCPRRHWYSSALDACVPCTQCVAPAAAIVLRPCQLHQDTVCGTLNDLEFEWNLLQRQQHQQQQQQQQLRHEDGSGGSVGPEGGAVAAGGGVQSQGVWDWQPSSMAFAAVACILFVVALVYILYQHAKQWRHMENMERRFDRDVEQLSAQLMHNIVDLRTIDTSSPKCATFVSGTSGSGCSGSNTTGAMLHRMHDPPGLSRADSMRSSTKHAKRKPLGMAMSKALGLANGVPTTALIVPASAAGSMGADMLPGEMRCVYLEQLLVGPAAIRGNVYTEDTAPKKSSAVRNLPASGTNLGSNGNGISAKGLQRMQSAFGKK